MAADFQFVSHGSVCILTPYTSKANVWASEHLPEDAQRWASGYVIEPRYAYPIIDGIQNAGLTVECSQ